MREGEAERKGEVEEERERERKREREPIRRKIFHVVEDIMKNGVLMCCFHKEGSISAAGYLSYYCVSEAPLIRAFST